jgi:CheY-like chemotaxis protein
MDAKKSKILIVDDDPDITRVIRVILESRNYIVADISSTADGIRKLAEFRPDLVILDVMMDSMSDGFEFSVKIKDHPEFKKIPVLLYTGIDSSTGVNFKSAMGNTNQIKADGYLEKPATPQIFLAEVERLLSL